jgi:hypothetical protein
MYTYDECQAIISEKGEYIYSDGLYKKLVIVPFNKDYFNSFNKDLMTKNLSKDDVKMYAKDGEYTIWAYGIQLLKGEVFNV